MAKIIEKIRGHKVQLKRFSERVQDEKLGQTLLFVGPEGIGKRLVAKAIAQSLVCEISQNACGSCGACTRIEKEQSESLLLIKPTGTGIKVDQARDVIHFTSLKTQGQARCVIINDANKLNHQAANALLKTLEEPPEKTYFFLIAPSHQSVLMTIRSRAQVTRFGPLDQSDLSPNEQIPQWVIEASGGRLDRLGFLSEPESLEIRKRALALFMSLTDSNLSRPFETIKEVCKDKTEAIQITRLLQQFVRDLAVMKYDATKMIHKDLRPHFEQMQKLSHSSLDLLFLHLKELERDIERHVDRTLSMEEFWLSGRKELSKETVCPG